MRVSQIAASKWMRKTKGREPRMEMPIQMKTLRNLSPAPSSLGIEIKSIGNSVTAHTRYQNAHAFRIRLAPFISVSCLNHRVKCGPGLPPASRRNRCPAW
jgi:hypothetical protein